MTLPPDKAKRYSGISREYRKPEYINLNPIQRGGILSEAARRALQEFGDGYSICDWCPAKTPRLDLIDRPPVREFLADLAEFLGMDVARVTTRCRESKFIVFRMLGWNGGCVVVDSLAHYSTYLAAELAGLEVLEVPHSGPPEYRVNLEAYAKKIEEAKRRFGGKPVAALLTHVDSYYGNLNDARAVAKICNEYEVPLVLNAAYTSGVMPVDGRSLGVDIIVGSGHKSWASSAPIGILALKGDLAEKILARSRITGDWSGRSFQIKEFALLGCTVMGAPLATLMASFPYVVERVQRWEEEVRKAQYLVEQLERIEGTRLLGVKPKMHTLIHVESEGFYKVSKSHKRRGFFLYDELKARGIVGIQPGLSRHFKLNTYGLTWEQVKYVAEAFQEIARKYGLAIY